MAFDVAPAGGDTFPSLAAGAGASCAAEGVALTPNAVGYDFTVWYGCAAAAAAAPSAGLLGGSFAASFRFDAQVSGLYVNATWTCGGGSADAGSRGAKVEVFGWDTLPLACREMQGDPKFRRRCELEDGFYDVEVCEVDAAV